MRTILIPLLLICSLNTWSQGKLNLISGEVVNWSSIKIDSNWIEIQYKDQKERMRSKQLSFADVLSVEEGNTEVFYYNRVEDSQEMFAPRDMKVYVEGIRSGRAQYNRTRHWLLGASVGLVGGVAMNSVMYGLLLPPVYTLCTKAFPISKKRFVLDDREKEELFLFGRSHQYKKMRTADALKSNACGMIVGLVLGRIIAQP